MDEKTSRSSLGKILLKNGFFDMRANIFSFFFNPKIVFSHEFLLIMNHYNILIDNTWKILKDIGEQFYKVRVLNTFIAYPTYTVGRFHNYTFTKSGTSLIAYFDSVAYSSSNTSGDPVSFSNNLALGSYRLADAQVGGYLLPQSYGNILFYNRALTGTEVLQNYNATKTRFGL